MVGRNMNPFVSVLTPVFNGEAFIQECIESVLAQTYSNWEYIIVNNCSNDRTLEIAKKYEIIDPRIRVHNNKEFLRINANYNNSIRLISPNSIYCKIIAADDFLFPECLEEMVKLAEACPAVGLIGAYSIASGCRILAQGLPSMANVFSGKDICRLRLIDGIYVFGTPSFLLYRSAVLRKYEEFFNESNIHADEEACMKILKDWNFGFVHKILTFYRIREGSLTAFSDRINTNIAGRLYHLVKYGRHYLTKCEFDLLLKKKLDEYYQFLGENIFRFRGMEFWRFHKKKLQSYGYPLNYFRLTMRTIIFLFDIIFNPKNTCEKLIRRLAKSNQTKIIY